MSGLTGLVSLEPEALGGAAADPFANIPQPKAPSKTVEQIMAEQQRMPPQATSSTPVFQPPSTTEAMQQHARISAAFSIDPQSQQRQMTMQQQQQMAYQQQQQMAWQKPPGGQVVEQSVSEAFGEVNAAPMLPPTYAGVATKPQAPVGVSEAFGAANYMPMGGQAQQHQPFQQQPQQPQQPQAGFWPQRAGQQQYQGQQGAAAQPSYPAYPSNVSPQQQPVRRKSQGFDLGISSSSSPLPGSDKKKSSKPVTKKAEALGELSPW